MGNYWASWIALPVAAIVIGAALMFSVGGADFCHMGHDDEAEDDAEDKVGEDTEEAKEHDSVSSEEGAAPAGDEPATWHGSSVEVDDLWPSGAPAQEVPPRSLEL